MALTCHRARLPKVTPPPASFPGRFFTNRTPGEKYGLVLIVFGRVCRDRKIHCKTSRKNTNQSTQCSQMKMTSPLASYVLQHSSNTREQVQRISVLPGRLGRLLICQYMVVPGGLRLIRKLQSSEAFRSSARQSYQKHGFKDQLNPSVISTAPGSSTVCNPMRYGPTTSEDQAG